MIRRAHSALHATAGVLGACCWLAAGAALAAHHEQAEAEAAGAPAAMEEALPVGVEAIDAFIASRSIDKSEPDWKTDLPRPPKVGFAEDQKIFWLLDTNKGSIKLELFPRSAPMHVSSTIYLTRLGFYDGVVFHRVIPGFMAQGGDPLGRGHGGPGYKYTGEIDRALKHDKPGILSMANAGPGTDGSQFFILFNPQRHLDGRHTIFGEVVEGMGTVRALEQAGSPGGRTSEPLKIVTASILVE